MHMKLKQIKYFIHALFFKFLWINLFPILDYENGATEVVDSLNLGYRLDRHFEQSISRRPL